MWSTCFEASSMVKAQSGFVHFRVIKKTACTESHRLCRAGEARKRDQGGEQTVAHEQRACMAGRPLRGCSQASCQEGLQRWVKGGGCCCSV